jgi:3-oxoacid CoA-transferase subunit B
VVVLQSHVSQEGTPKLVTKLTLPATALGCAKRVITELGVFDVAGDCFVCVVRAAGVDRQAIERATGARVLFTTVTASG